MTETTFHQQVDIELDEPTLIEGLPGQGLVASITADQITDQLELEQHGTIRSDEFPSAVSFSDGLFQDTVRVYAGPDAGVMTLQSDVPIPQPAFSELSQCVLNDLAEEFQRAIFLAGAPAQSEDQRGDVLGLASTEELREELEDAGIEIMEESGAVGGVTGALATACYRNDVPAALLLVRVEPRLPDPKAAHSLIENALEPLVEFDIETDALLEQAEKIQQQKQQIAQQLQQAQDQEGTMQSQAMFQ